MLIDGGWPILDHDDDAQDFISQSLRGREAAGPLPAAAVLAFLGTKVAERARLERGAEIDMVDMITVSYPVYGLRRGDRRIALVETPVGAAAAVMLAEHLIRRGVVKLIAVGSCGALTDLVEGHFILPVRALRAEGTSYHYLPPGEWAQTDPELRRHCRQAVANRGLPVTEADTWTTDGFFRETPAMIAHRRSQGCTVVEMECAALSACCQFRGVGFAQLLFTADSLSGDSYDARGFGVAVHEVALGLAIDAAFAC